MSSAEQWEEEGVSLHSGVLDGEAVFRLRDALDAAIARAAYLQRSRGVGESVGSDLNPEGADGPLGGAAHHVVVHGGAFLDFLASCPLLDRVQEYLGGGHIVLNAFGGVSNPSEPGAYEHAKLVHRDTRSHHPEFRQLLWMFVMLDDFTADNGATWVQPGSWRLPERPTDEAFRANAVQIVAPAGSILLIDGRVWHAAGQNLTPHPRRLLTLAFSRPFVKPQMDYCRALGLERVAAMPQELRQLLGFYARVPASLEEWYAPPEERCYRSNQG